MYAPSPATCMHTPQREFAGAKVQIIFDIYKLMGIFLRKMSGYNPDVMDGGTSEYRREQDTRIEAERAGRHASRRRLGDVTPST